MNILMVGDIVGSPGRKAFASITQRMKNSGELDFVVANGENAAGGRGITAAIVRELLEAGADVITLGDHVWDQKEFQTTLAAENRVLRPANLPPDCPGQGLVTVNTAWGPVSVINLIGRVFMKPADCPFRTADRLLAENRLTNQSIVIVDMHAEATSEKIALGRYLDGRVSCVAGTHTHVQTGDETILPGGTAYLTDLGMTGAKDSVLGRDVKPVLHSFLTGMPAKFSLAKNDVCLEGALIDIDRNSGKAQSIRRIREKPE